MRHLVLSPVQPFRDSPGELAGSTLLLSYMPLRQRLPVAIGPDVTEADALLDFHLDHADYIASIEGGEVM